MNKKLLSMLCLMGSAVAAHAQIPTQMTNRFQTVMDSLTANVHTIGTNETLGISFAITIPGYGSWQGASGQADNGVPLTTNMTMGLASNSKLYLSVLMLRLQEEGILSLDDTIGEWITEPLPNVDMDITIRQLLLHQSGLFDIVNDGSDVFWDNVFTDWTVFWDYPETFTMIQEPEFVKGTAFQYSNSGFALAAYIIETATGNSFSHNLHQYITEPLNLTMTFDAAEDTVALDNVQESASYTIDSWWPRLGSVAAASMVRGMGSIVATPRDVDDFYQALFNTPFLTEVSMQQLLAFEPGSGYGLGIERRFSPAAGADSYGHGGSYIGFLSQAFYDPKTGASFFVISNSDQVETLINSFVIRVFKESFPKKTNDAGISQIVSPHGGNCATAVVPTVVLKNFGSNVLTAATIYYQIDNGTAQTHSWTGSLASGEVAEVSLPAITAAQGSHVLNVWTSAPNGATEGNPYNDGVNANFAVITDDTLPSTFSEDFEGISPSVTTWNPQHSISHQWGITHLSAASGNGSFVINNYANGVPGTESYIDIPMLHLGTGSQQLTFDYAYESPENTDDSLEVLVSDDCGVTWVSQFNKAGAELSAGLIAEEYYQEYFPQTSASWHSEIISLDAYADSDILIRFKAVNDKGNNLFLDDIQVGTTLGITELNKNLINVYPNPATDKIIVTGLAEGTKILLYTIAGQKILDVAANGDTSIDISKLTQGIYFLNTEKGSVKIIKK